jgi:hypothetical protein
MLGPFQNGHATPAPARLNGAHQAGCSAAENNDIKTVLHWLEDLSAAWVRFPELTLQPLPQEYLRLGDCKYRYSSRGGAFVAELLVDEHDLVLDYEGFWQRAPKMH